MISEIIKPGGLVTGRALLVYTCLDRHLTGNKWQPNKITHDWATIVAKLLTGAADGKQYKIGGMYLEFENNGGAAVTVPDDEDIDRSEGVEYYQSLSGDRDYLRVPIIAGLVDSTSALEFPSGNRTTFYAQSAGTVGMNGLPFNHTVSSRVYGAGLVAFPEFADDTQDLVFARVYFQPDNQLVKIAGSQIGVTWQHVYG